MIKADPRKLRRAPHTPAADFWHRARVGVAVAILIPLVAHFL
ncbi:hypothetical protein [Acidimangrovimonas pyrenivorans]|uniref:Uncharacterized protein n=1 Tax=Acidimangrovimonas pyrenivorans TaxID=2030798 RepID=A0ABV7AP48_9RHOB